MQRGITKRTQINSSWTGIITASLMLVLQNTKTRNDGTEWVENQCAHSIPPLPHTQLIQRIQWLRWPTANLLRLRMLNWSRQRPSGSESFQRSWTHQTDLYPTSSKSLQTLQTSNSWAGVFLTLNAERRMAAVHSSCSQTRSNVLLLNWFRARSGASSN